VNRAMGQVTRRGGVRAAAARGRVMLLLGIAIIALSISWGAPSRQPTLGHIPPAGGRDAVGAQYDSTHVYVAPGMIDAFTASWEATFGGTHTATSVTDVTPTPSQTKSELILSPVGTLSVFDFQTPIPYPFGAERTGWLMKNFDQGVQDAKTSGADVIVTPFNDPIGRDAIVQFPGGVNTQLYWHTTAPSYAPLVTLPENRIYVSADAASAFLRAYVTFTGGRIVSDDPRADGGEIGQPHQTYRRVRISSPFGDTIVMITDGHLPYPFGREITGYTVANLDTTLTKATAAGATILWGPYSSAHRHSAILRFPGGYLAEIHDTIPR
jgi:hypothetical protein